MKSYCQIGKAVLSATAAILFFSQTPVQAGEILRFKESPVTATQLKATFGRLSDRMGELSGAKAYYVVQFKQTITAQDQQNLRTLGAKILRYLPDDAFLIQASPRLARTIEVSSPSVQVIVPFQAKWKISSELSNSSVFNASQTQALVMRLVPLADNEKVLKELSSISSVKVTANGGRTIYLQAKMSEIENIAHIEGIEWLQADPQMGLLDMRLLDDGDRAPTNPPPVGTYTDLTGYESGTKVLNFDAAWSRGFTGEGQIAAMADTGLDRGDINSIHGDFAGRISQGYIFGMFSKSWEDPMGHGTHVAGSITGTGATSNGAIRGGAFKAKFVPESMWSPMLSNLTVPPKLKDLFDKAYTDGARVHSNSWGAAANFGAYDSFAQQVDEYMFAHPDFLLVFAAGNSGEDPKGTGRIDPGSVSSPGTSKNALTVGASKNLVATGGIQKKLSELHDGAKKWGAEPIASEKLSDNPNGLAMFSSRGPTQDGRIKPEVVAPGTNILSTRSHQPDAETLWGEYNAEYLWCGGTSMATPLVAGAATVVREYLVKDRHLANPSAALVKGVLMHTAFDMFPGQFGAVGADHGQELLTQRPNSDEGYGRVDMDKATKLSSALIIDEKSGVATGDVQSYSVHVNHSGHMIVTMVYTDAPAAENVSKSLVNDLDLVVVDPSGKETTLNDHTNNSEMLQMDAMSGDYTVRVKGTNVPQGMDGKQPYALLVSVE